MWRPKRIAITQLAVTALLVTGAVASTNLDHGSQARSSVGNGETMADVGTNAEPDVPQNIGEAAKLANARAAVVAATASGTRWMLSPDSSPSSIAETEAPGGDASISLEQAEAEKQLLRARQQPRSLPYRPGMPSGSQEGGR